MIRRTPLLLALSLAIGACGTPLQPTGTAQLGEPFWIGVNEVVAIPPAEFAIRFEEVLEDSRCPGDPEIVCVWAGRVRIRIRLQMDIDAVHELRFMDEPGAVMQGGYRIELIAIDPATRSVHLPALGGYRARLRVVESSAPAPG